MTRTPSSISAIGPCLNLTGRPLACMYASFFEASAPLLRHRVADMPAQKRTVEDTCLRPSTAKPVAAAPCTACRCRKMCGAETKNDRVGGLERIPAGCGVEPLPNTALCESGWRTPLRHRS